MSVKHKLNQAHLLLCLLVAGVAGGLTGSLVIFVFTFCVLAAVAFHAGDIRR